MELDMNLLVKLILPIGLLVAIPLIGHDNPIEPHIDRFYLDDEDEDDDDYESVSEEPEPWHRHYQYSEDDLDFDSPRAELDYETASPGERVDFYDSISR